LKVDVPDERMRVKVKGEGESVGERVKVRRRG
jgi:hypothetical protein